MKLKNEGRLNNKAPKLQGKEQFLIWSKSKKVCALTSGRVDFFNMSVRSSNIKSVPVKINSKRKLFRRIAWRN